MNKRNCLTTMSCGVCPLCAIVPIISSIVPLFRSISGCSGLSTVFHYHSYTRADDTNKIETTFQTKYQLFFPPHSKYGSGLCETWHHVNGMSEGGHYWPFQYSHPLQGQSYTLATLLLFTQCSYNAVTTVQSLHTLLLCT